MSDPLAVWIRTVHASLSPGSQVCLGAHWGPVRMEHHTTRPDWYGAIDKAWAAPAVDDEGSTTAPIHIKVISAAFDDLPAAISPPPLRRRDLGPRGEAAIPPGSTTRLTWEEAAGQVMAWDPQSGCALLLRSTPPNGYDLVSPMRWLVHWGIAAAGGILMHAASVGRPSEGSVRGALLIGEAGYGKSTTTLACLSRGWLTCGDDAVAVMREGESWVARAIYAAVKTKLVGSTPPPPDLPSTGLNTVTWDIAGTKRVHLLTSTDGQTLCERMEIDALILLDPAADPEADRQAATAAEARTRATPSTLIPLPYERETTMQRIGRIASEVPASRLPRRSSLAQTFQDVTGILNDSTRQ
ncbi:hypothetical protein [Synechococcus sp. CBW1004]|uniref:hypothetical protein n=1 Tax=Synechococcus sp. CBW1004 TaxID=1353136 RepID=UPI0018CE617F|nr:hypothetical protein [Synechococcus sp. CBW1004]QPN62403.1 hypothetical protein H8F25_11840 [Synechococcus sp. CBW1004]